MLFLYFPDIFCKHRLNFVVIYFFLNKLNDLYKSGVMFFFLNLFIYYFLQPNYVVIYEFYFCLLFFHKYLFILSQYILQHNYKKIILKQNDYRIFIFIGKF